MVRVTGVCFMSFMGYTTSKIARGYGVGGRVLSLIQKKEILKNAGNLLTSRNLPVHSCSNN